jgi:hypothetical protein
MEVCGAALEHREHLSELLHGVPPAVNVEKGCRPCRPSIRQLSSHYMIFYRVAAPALPYLVQVRQHQFGFKNVHTHFHHTVRGFSPCSWVVAFKGQHFHK